MKLLAFKKPSEILEGWKEHTNICLNLHTRSTSGPRYQSSNSGILCLQAALRLTRFSFYLAHLLFLIDRFYYGPNTAKSDYAIFLTCFWMEKNQHWRPTCKLNTQSIVPLKKVILFQYKLHEKSISLNSVEEKAWNPGYTDNVNCF